MDTWIDPINVFYYSLNNIFDVDSFIKLIDRYLEIIHNDKQRRYIFLDEITYIKNFERGLKYFADIWLFENVTVIITGSNMIDLKYWMEKLPWRRWEDVELDKILRPLTYKEFVKLFDKDLFEKISSKKLNFELYRKELEKLFWDYMCTWWFPLAINEYYKNWYINQDVYNIYLSWILWDVAKLWKREEIFFGIANQLIESQTLVIGYDTIAKKLGFVSHTTVWDYIKLLENIFAIKIIYQIDMNTKLPNLRKWKKIYFRDMFVFWILYCYVRGIDNYYDMIKQIIFQKNRVFLSKLIENIVMINLLEQEKFSNFNKILMFYRDPKTNKEIDFIHYWKTPYEVKYSNNISNTDFNTIKKYFDSWFIISDNTSKTTGNYESIELLKFLFYY